MSATDELRTLANRMDELVLETPDMLREAADEIDQLVMKLNAEHLVRQNVERENAKLRELLVGAFEDMDAWQKVIAGSNEWGYGKGCLDRLCKLGDAMQELGMEVEVR